MENLFKNAEIKADGSFGDFMRSIGQEHKLKGLPIEDKMPNEITTEDINELLGGSEIEKLETLFGVLGTLKEMGAEMGDEMEANEEACDDCGEPMEPREPFDYSKIKFGNSEELDKFYGATQMATPEDMDIPCNISKSKDDKITFVQMPVAGFTKDDIEVHLSEKKNGYFLDVSGKVKEVEAEADVNYNYTRKDYEVAPFTRTFELSEEEFNGEISVDMEHGILTIAVTPVEVETKSKKLF